MLFTESDTRPWAAFSKKYRSSSALERKGTGMEYTLDMGAWNSVFAVPCSLVDTHIKLAGKEQLQVILWMLRHAGEAVSPAELSTALGISKDSVLDALEYWQDRGLLAGHEGSLFPAGASEAAPAAQKQPAPSQEKPPEPASVLPPKKRLVKPDASYLAARIKESDSIRFLLQEAETTLGILSPAMTSVLLASCDDYGLPVEVVVMLVHYAKEVGKTGTAYIDSVARDWAESNVFTLEAAEEKLRELSEKRLAWGKVSAVAGLPKRHPSKKEEEAAYRWVCQWKFSQDMLSAAYERCVDHTGKLSISYMNKILNRWHEEGIQNKGQLEQAEQKKQEEKRSSASYDIDELESLSFFDPPEEL